MSCPNALKRIIALACVLVLCLVLCGCAESTSDEGSADAVMEVSDVKGDAKATSKDVKEKEPESKEKELPKLDIVQDFSHADQFNHGEKPAKYQKYIVLHDTEGTSDAKSVISYWAGNGRKVAAHFIVNRDGSIYQCVDMDKIAHHVGFGNTGHNKKYGVTDESRDDKAGTKSIGSKCADYGMNSYSIGIEMVHVSGGADYTKEQLESVDKLIAYIDAYYGFESTIIDHKDWRQGNSDTSAEFSKYLANYKDHRAHD